VTGVGFADFSAAYTPERIRETDVEIIAPWRPAFRDPHNLIIGTLGELGTVGLIVLAAFLLPHLLRRGWGPDAAVVQAAFAAMIVMAMFLDLLNRKEIWLLIGISWGLAWLARRPVETGLGLEPASVPVSLSPATGT
jgi:O-antigen ligase